MFYHREIKNSSKFIINSSLFGIFKNLHVINDNIFKYLNNNCYKIKTAILIFLIFTKNNFLQMK